MLETRHQVSWDFYYFNEEILALPFTMYLTKTNLIHTNLSPKQFLGMELQSSLSIIYATCTVLTNQFSNWFVMNVSKQMSLWVTGTGNLEFELSYICVYKNSATTDFSSSWKLQIQLPPSSD